MPPGRRHMPEWSWRSSAMVSGRNPCTLSAGIRETVPMWKLPLPVPVISRAPSVVSACDVKLSGNFLYSLVSAGMEMVCRSFAPFTPDERDLHLAAGSAAKIDAACILLAFDQSEARLPNAVRRGGVERDARALVADKRLVLVHHHSFVGTNGTPFAKLHAAWTRRPGGGAGASGSLDEIGK